MRVSGGVVSHQAAATSGYPFYFEKKILCCDQAYPVRLGTSMYVCEKDSKKAHLSFAQEVTPDPKVKPNDETKFLLRRLEAF